MTCFPVFGTALKMFLGIFYNVWFVQKIINIKYMQDGGGDGGNAQGGLVVVVVVVMIMVLVAHRNIGGEVRTQGNGGK